MNHNDPDLATRSSNSSSHGERLPEFAIVMNKSSLDWKTAFEPG
jgi:hypothetical protein